MINREVTGTINKDGFVTFDEEIEITEPQTVTIIFRGTNQDIKPAKLKTQQELIDEIIQGLHEAITGKTTGRYQRYGMK